MRSRFRWIGTVSIPTWPQDAEATKHFEDIILTNHRPAWRGVLHITCCVRFMYALYNVFWLKMSQPWAVSFFWCFLACNSAYSAVSNLQMGHIQIGRSGIRIGVGVSKGTAH